MRFAGMPIALRVRAESLLREYLARERHRDVVPGTRAFYHLVGAAASVARHGPPPTRNQRLGYRMHKKRRARLAALALYGDPSRPDSAA